MPATGRKRDIFLFRRNAVPTAWIFSQETNALMIALYIVMDSFGTATNVTGDGAIAVILDKIYKHDHHITEDETEV